MFGVKQPPRTPAYFLHYLSFTPPSLGQKLYIVSHNKSSSQVPRNLKSLGNFKGLCAIFLVFCVDRQGMKVPSYLWANFRKIRKGGGTRFWPRALRELASR